MGPGRFSRSPGDSFVAAALPAQTVASHRIHLMRRSEPREGLVATLGSRERDRFCLRNLRSPYDIQFETSSSRVAPLASQILESGYRVLALRVNPSRAAFQSGWAAGDLHTCGEKQGAGESTGSAEAMPSWRGGPAGHLPDI
jgi:hypothetical protein